MSKTFTPDEAYAALAKRDAETKEAIKFDTLRAQDREQQRRLKRKQQELANIHFGRKVQNINRKLNYAFIKASILASFYLSKEEKARRLEEAAKVNQEIFEKIMRSDEDILEEQSNIRKFSEKRIQKEATEGRNSRIEIPIIVL